MGFVSPAGDYVERRLNPDDMLTTDQSRILETSTGYAVIEPVSKLKQGMVLILLFDGHIQFAKLQERSLITEDGEAIEGEAAELVEVMGRVTFFINRAREDENPLI